MDQNWSINQLWTVEMSPYKTVSSKLSAVCFKFKNSKGMVSCNVRNMSTKKILGTFCNSRLVHTYVGIFIFFITTAAFSVRFGTFVHTQTDFEDTETGAFGNLLLGWRLWDNATLLCTGNQGCCFFAISRWYVLYMWPYLLEEQQTNGIARRTFDMCPDKSTLPRHWGWEMSDGILLPLYSVHTYDSFLHCGIVVVVVKTLPLFFRLAASPTLRGYIPTFWSGVAWQCAYAFANFQIGVN